MAISTVMIYVRCDGCRASESRVLDPRRGVPRKELLPRRVPRKDPAACDRAWGGLGERRRGPPGDRPRAHPRRGAAGPRRRGRGNGSTTGRPIPSDGGGEPFGTAVRRGRRVAPTNDRRRGNGGGA